MRNAQCAMREERRAKAPRHPVPGIRFPDPNWQLRGLTPSCAGSHLAFRRPGYGPGNSEEGIPVRTTLNSMLALTMALTACGEGGADDGTTITTPPINTTTLAATTSVGD